MKAFSFFVLFLVSAAASIAQPAYSPEVRAQRATKWMQDSAHVNEQLAARYNETALKYERKMDKLTSSNDQQKTKKLQQLRRKKDAEIKAMLNKGQYRMYYKKETETRRQADTHHAGPHQPM